MDLDPRPETPVPDAPAGHDGPPPSGAGPYRTSARKPPPPPRRVPPVLIVAGASIGLGLLLLLVPAPAPERAGLADAPAIALDAITSFPQSEPELPPSTPLAPLLVADAPESLAVIHPPEGASRVVRGETLSIRFNRPMVRGSEVGRELARAPIVFSPAVEGTFRWATRSTLVFVPAPSAFDRNTESSLGFRDELASLDGEALYDETPRVMVFDGSPRFLTHHASVAVGQPLTMEFDSRVSAAELSREMIAWEASGRRAVPVRIAERGMIADEDGSSPRFRIDLVPSRALEAGARVSVALGPRFDRWGGSYPRVVQFELAPRPRIVGIACEDSSWGTARCTFTDDPGQIVDIGPSLRILASTALGAVDAADVRVTPPLRGLRVSVEGAGSEVGRVLGIAGEWEPDQVYEVRFGALVTAAGERVVPLAPLAVRSAGHAPQVIAPSGVLAYERGVPIPLRLRGIHVDRGRVIVRPVPEGREAAAILGPASFAVQEQPITVPLAALMPDARPNRWGRATLDVRATAPGFEMMVVAFQPDERTEINALTASLVQSTDLGITAEALPQGVLVWVSSIARAQPVAGARVELRDTGGDLIVEARTDAAGAAWLRGDGRRGAPMDWDALAATTVVVARAGSDRAALVLDPRRAVGPSALGVVGGPAAAGSRTADAFIRATVIADRGAYRPGEPIHAVAIARRIEGARATLPHDAKATLRVMAGSTAVPIVESEVRMRRGRADASWTLPEGTPLGTHRVELLAGDHVLGATMIEVAEFRQPRFRVDLGTPAGALHAGDTVAIAASARYLFGAPLEGATMRWSIAREGRASFPARWDEYAFGPAAGSARAGTLAEGEATLDRSGAATLSAPVELEQPVRTRIRVEAEVTDATGQTTSSSRTLTAYPASLEVGVRRRDAWVPLGEAVAVEAIAIDHGGAAIEGAALEARVVREGWHSWWEWSRGESEDESAYQMRRGQRSEVAHTCRMSSSATEPARCAFTPTRAGTYLLEVRGRDERGRETIAQRRVYVAGPDETPDRDPPGAPIALTPAREIWTVGEEAEIAFESPWAEAEALIAVHQGTLLSMERRRVGAGGQIVRVALTDDMVPNAFVTIALVRPRAGEPGETIDLNAPDLRFGSAELHVRPRTSRLEVSIEAAGEGRPGSRVPVIVRVEDEHGDPVGGAQVVLWAVDEGTLRMTGYRAPSPSEGFFVERGAAFALEDLRRALVSRIAPTIEAEAGGDGGFVADVTDLPERERFDPTPLWAPRLITGRDGAAGAELVLPDRPTEYRVMAVAIDEGLRSGEAGSSVVAEQPLVVRGAFPRFATDGDRFDAVAFLHNGGAADVVAEVSVRVGDAERASRSVAIPAGGEVRVAETIEVRGVDTIPIRIEARATIDGEPIAHAAEGRVPVMPAARWVRRRAVVGGTGERALGLAFAEAGAPSPRGELRVSMASHPFVGLDGALDALDESWWGGTEVEAARLLALSSYLRMSAGLRRGGRSEDELRERAQRALTRLLRARSIDGGFGRWSIDQGAMPHETAVAARALIAAEQAGIRTPEGLRQQTLDRLAELVAAGAFGETYGRGGQESWALALRLLGESGTRGPGIDSLYESREFASPGALAQLALALPDGDARGDTALLLAVHRLFPELDIPALHDDRGRMPGAVYVERDVSSIAAVLEAASRRTVGLRWLGMLATELLRTSGQRGDGLGYPPEIAVTIAALSACADRFASDAALAATLAIDGAAVGPRTTSAQAATFEVPWGRVAEGAHRLLARASDPEDPLFVALDARWSEPIGEAEQVARGRAVTLHRVLETAAGTPIVPGARVPLGTMIRVRLFVHLEQSAPDRVAVRDPIGGGFESVDAGMATTPHASLMALLGASADDDTTDPRGFHAMRSLSYVEHRALDTHATTFYLSGLPPGLHELTYAVRATTPGTFVVPPAEIAAMRDEGFVARSTAITLGVDP